MLNDAARAATFESKRKFAYFLTNLDLLFVSIGLSSGCTVDTIFLSTFYGRIETCKLEDRTVLSINIRV